MWCTGMLIAGVVGVFLLNALAISQIKVGAYKSTAINFLSMSQALAELISTLVFAAGFFGLVMSTGVDLVGERFRPKKTIFGRLVKITSGSADNYCVATAKFGVITTSAVTIVCLVGAGIYTGILFGMAPYILQIAKILGVTLILAIVVYALLFATLMLASTLTKYSPRIVSVTMRGTLLAALPAYVLYHVFTQSNPQMIREIGESLLAVVAVVGISIGICLLVTRIHGLYPLVCPKREIEEGQK